MLYKPFVRLAAVCAAALLLASSAPRAVSSSIVISQVYGGGGNTGAPYTHDFIELFNRGNAPASLAGWSLQYASATGTGNFGATATMITDLPNVTLSPGQYFLVQQAGGTSGVPLAADHVDPTPIAMAAGAGKVALASTTSPLGCNGGSTPCSAAALASIVDLVGYGNANFFEGAAAAPALTNSTAASRGDGGCTDTDNNGADFTAGAPAPRNLSSSLKPCDAAAALSIDDVTVTEGNSGAVTATFTVQLSAPAPTGGVTFTIATLDDTATVADNDYVARTESASIPQGQQTYTFSVTVNGDTTIEPNEQFFVNLTNAVGATIADGQGIGTIQNDDFQPPTYEVVISQVYGGGGNANATYQHDFVELFNQGTIAVSLAGWSVQYASAGGSAWSVTPLSGTIAPGSYYLVRGAAGTGCSGAPCGAALIPPDATGTTNMSAAAGRVVLSSGTTAFANGACPAGGTVVDLVGYGNTACAETAAAGAPSNTTAALRKRGGCFDSDDNSYDFAVSTPTPRNSSTAARSCQYLTVPIHAIQGSGLQTPLLGQDVTTTGIVTGVKGNGFFVQTPDADADSDPSTSQGLFVFTGAAPAAAPGDEVTVKGTATEFFRLTQIESTLLGDVVIASSGNALPSAVALTPQWLDPNGDLAQLEPLEGMRVHAATLVSVAPTNGFGEIYAVLGGVSRPMREPGIEVSRPVPPDPISGEVDCCIPRWDRNPERIMIDTDGLAGSAAVHTTSNVTFTNVTGPLDFTFSNYKVLPESLSSATAGMTAAPVPQPAANEFTVAGYNIENFNSANTTQLAKTALAIRTVLRYPDVIGAIEVRNVESLDALAARVNQDAVAAGDANPAYEARLVPASPTATQNVGFLVKTSRVRIDGVTQELKHDTFVNPVNGNTETLHDRPPLVLRATVDPEGLHSGPIIVVVNHLRSFIDIELVAGEGVRVREKRTKQAESVAGLLQQLQSDHPGTPVISVGDYNAFEFNDGYTDPIAILKGAPTPTENVVVGGSPDLVDPDFINLTDTLPADQRYSYVFEGTPQTLDHVLVNGVAYGLLQRYAIARNNADFPDHPAAGLSGDAGRPEANSDHDMPIAYFAFPGTPVVALNGGATLEIEAYTTFADPGATATIDGVPVAVSVSGSVDVDTPGDYELTYTATNGFVETAVSRLVKVRDRTPPDIADLAVTPSSIRPPDHRMVDVAIAYTATDASGAVACSVSAASNEPANATGDGNTAVDWIVMSERHVQVRAERSGRGNGRVYTLTITCADGSGNQRTRTAAVTVPK